MASKVTKNTFNRGLNKDLERQKMSPDSYVDAKNIQITGKDDFLGAKIRQSSKPLLEIDTPFTTKNVLGSAEGVGLYDIGTYAGQTEIEKNNSIVFFVKLDAGLLTESDYIFLYDITRDFLHTVLSGNMNFPPEGTIDTVVFGEKGVDNVYFVDWENELRKLPLRIPSQLVNIRDLTIIPYAPIDKLSFTDIIEEGGNTESGTYQFAYQYFNTVNKKHTTWSLLTNPIPIYPTPFSVTDKETIVGGIPEESTQKGVLLNVNKTLVNSELYDSIKLAVVKNTTGSKTVATTFFETAPNKDWYTIGEIRYLGGGEETQKDISELVIEDAAIQAAKTLRAKENRLYQGNIKYRDRVVENITFSGARTILESVGSGSEYLPIFNNSNNPTFTLDKNLPSSSSDIVTGTIGLDISAGNIYELYLGGIINTTRITYIATDKDVEIGTRSIISNIVSLFSTLGIINASAKVVSDTQFEVTGLLSGSVIDSSALQGVNTSIQEVSAGGDLSGYGYKNPKNCVERRGYFRDEVYRFGIAYMDDFGSWSNPIPFDFSNYNALTPTGNTFPVFSSFYNGNYTTIEFTTNNTSPQWEQGQAIEITGTSIHDGIYTVLSSTVAFPLETVIIGGAIDATAGTGEVLGIKTGSWAKEGTDWKFPSRDNPSFTLFNNEGGVINGGATIDALGIEIQGITNHPSWARAMAIVRLPREKNILYQSPHIPAPAFMPTLNYKGGDDPCELPVGASQVGTYAPKTHLRGGAKNLLRARSNNTGLYDSPSLLPYTGEGVRLKPTNVMALTPPEYMYNFNGEPFENISFENGSYVNAVDAATYFMTPPFAVDGSIDNGDDNNDKLAMALRADNKRNYYYQRGTVKGRLKDSENFANQFADKTGINSISYLGAVERGQNPLVLPLTPGADSIITGDIISYGDLNGVSLQNYGRPVELQRALAVVVKERWGDLSYLALQQSETPTGNYNIYKDVVFNISNELFNHTLKSLHDVANTDIDNTIALYDTGAVCSSLILNIEKGIGDDRYGDLNSRQEYISTGFYTEIQSPTDVINARVFGGDCFITKTNIKINQSTVGIFDGDIGCDRGDNTNYQSRAYSDFQDILSVYLESEVNTDLATTQFNYPSIKGGNLSGFSNAYGYTYNFGYSVQNSAKIWISRTDEDENRNEFPSRIVASDQKIFQTNVEGFDRYRALSFYDLAEEYGGITKLTKLSNDNIYSIQRDAVAIIPIGKKVIEDGTGGELLINTDDLINTPQYLMTENGSQHIRSVYSSGSSIFFVDANKREVVKVGGQGDGKVSDIGMHSYFLEKLNTNIKIPEQSLFSGYDFNNDEYIVVLNSFEDTTYDSGNETGTNTVPSFISTFSEKSNSWVTEIILGSNVNIENFIFANKEFYLLGINNNLRIALEEMYSGSTFGNILGETTDASITFIVNPEEPVAKVFDNLRIDSSHPLSEAVIKVFEGNDTPSTTIPLAVKTRNNAYEVPTLRDEKNRRMRGRLCEVTLKITGGGVDEVKISSILTKYRTDPRVYGK